MTHPFRPILFSIQVYCFGNRLYMFAFQIKRFVFPQ